MKKTTLSALCVALLLPALLKAQFMTDYRPNPNGFVQSTINLISVVENNNAATGASRSVNTLQEAPGSNFTDIWLASVNNVGTIGITRRIGQTNVTERASALVRCPNGDFIVVGTTIFQNVQAVWLFRVTLAGGIVWSQRYLNTAARLTGFCIKQTNEAAENYVVAASLDPGSRLVVFKVTGGGGLIWNFQYSNPAIANYSDIPKSMFVLGANVVVAGNRNTISSSGATSQDLFAIGIDQVAGGITIPFRVLGDTTRVEIDPFINRGNGGAAGDLVMTYRYTVAVGGINTGRIGFMRLSAALNLINPVFFYFEPNTNNSYGHTIHSNGAGTGYDIGGGTTNAAGLPNPLFFSVTNAGGAVAGSYRRLWSNVPFNSTYMMQDAFINANRYEHHNFKTVGGQNSMSLLRNNALAVPCNDSQPVNTFSIGVTQIPQAYSTAPVLTQTPYAAANITQPGNFLTCTGAAGFFRSAEAVVEPAFGEEMVSGFKLYPTLVQGNAPLTIAMRAEQAGSVTVTVYNLQGQTVNTSRHITGKGDNLLQVAQSLRTGSYMVEVSNGVNTWRTKIVKEQ